MHTCLYKDWYKRPKRIWYRTADHSECKFNCKCICTLERQYRLVCFYDCIIGYFVAYNYFTAALCLLAWILWRLLCWRTLWGLCIAGSQTPRPWMKPRQRESPKDSVRGFSSSDQWLGSKHWYCQAVSSEVNAVLSPRKKLIHVI